MSLTLEHLVAASLAASCLKFMLPRILAGLVVVLIAACASATLRDKRSGQKINRVNLINKCGHWGSERRVAEVSATATDAEMSRLGTCNFREKEKSFNTQEETWRQTCEKERFIEVLAHPEQRTFHDIAQMCQPEGPAEDLS
eukprot:s1753_g5.t1